VRPVYVWMIVLAILALFAMIKVGVHVSYDEKKLRLELLISKFRLVLLGDDKPHKPKNKKQKQAPKKPKPKQTSPQKKKGKLLENPWILAVWDYLQDILAVIGKVLRSPTLDVLRLELWVGGGDSEKCAMNYGRICAVLSGVLPMVENTFGVRKRKINVWCCYDRDSIDVSAEAAITVRIYESFALAFVILGLGIKILLQARNYKKAVQNI